MPALTRTTAESLSTAMVATVRRNADSQSGLGWHAIGIVIHDGPPRFIERFTAESLHTSEAERNTPTKLSVTASESLRTDMSAASVSRYADAQTGFGWRNVGIWKHDAPFLTRTASDSLHISEAYETRSFHRTANDWLRVDMSAASAHRYAAQQMSASGIPFQYFGFRNVGIWLHDRERGGDRSTHDHLQINESVTIYLIQTPQDHPTIHEVAVIKRDLVRHPFVPAHCHIDEVATAHVAGPVTVTANDALTIAESATARKQQPFFRSTTESLSISELVGAPVRGPKFASCTDHLTTAEFAQRTPPIFRTATESIGVHDLVAQSINGSVLIRACRDFIHAVDVARLGAGGRDLVRSAVDSLHITEGAYSAVNTYVVYDALTVSDRAVVATFRPAGRSATESLHISESADAAVNVHLAADSLVISESATVQVVIGPRYIADRLFFLDIARRSLILNRSTTESLHTSEAISQTGSRTATDALHIAESATAVRSRALTATDSLSIAESVTAARFVVRSTTESLSISESVSKGYLRTASDALTIFELVVRGPIHPQRFATDHLVVSESVAIFLPPRSRFASDALHTAELARATASRPRSCADALHTSEFATASIMPAGEPIYVLPFPTGNVPTGALHYCGITA